MQSLIICHAVNLERPKPSQHYYELTTTVVNNCVLIVGLLANWNSESTLNLNQASFTYVSIEQGKLKKLLFNGNATTFWSSWLLECCILCLMESRSGLSNHRFSWNKKCPQTESGFLLKYLFREANIAKIFYNWGKLKNF